MSVSLISADYNSVGLICSDFLGSRYTTWQGLRFASNIHRSNSKYQSLKSSMVNVKILHTGQQNGPFSPFEGAVVCNGTFPHIENLTITHCSKAIVINDRFANQAISLTAISIVNCSYGIEVMSYPVLNSTSGSNVMPSFHFERITVDTCLKALEISDPGNKDIKLHDITISKCAFGIDVNNQELMNTITSEQLYERIKISECQKGIKIQEPSSKDIILNEITINNCSHGLDLFYQRTVKEIDLCHSNPRVHVESAVEVHADNLESFPSCSKVSNAVDKFPNIAS